MYSKMYSEDALSLILPSFVLTAKMKLLASITVLLTVFIVVTATLPNITLHFNPVGVMKHIVSHLGLTKPQTTSQPPKIPQADRDENGHYIGLYDPDCSDILSIAPARNTAEIKIDKKILKRGGTTCHYDIVGLADCVPSLSCKNFRLAPPTRNEDDPCEEEYLEVTDGNEGYEKFCGDVVPKSLTNGGALRDFYITVKLKPGANRRRFDCTVTCNPGKILGTPLLEQSEPSVDEDCNCGRKPNKNRIVGGVDSKKGEFPWMAALVATGTRKPYCGASVINDKLLLTAAHCFKGPYISINNFQVILNGHIMDLTEAHVAHGHGATDVPLTDQELAAADVKDSSYRLGVEKYFIHPMYIRQTNDFDVALIKLDKPIDFKVMKEVGPVCIPKPGLYKETKEGASAVIAGWGLNSSEAETTQRILQKLEIPVLTHAECKEYYGERYTRRFICAGFKEGGKDSCKGDSGGALVSEKSREIWEQIGIVSFGEGCAEAKKPGVYINTREVSQWINYISNLEDATWCSGN